MVYPAPVFAADFRSRLAAWDFPLGPFREPDDIVREMHAAAAALGPAAADDLADLVTTLAREHAREQQVLAEFLEIYVADHAADRAAALATALLARLGPAGPAALVEALGGTRSADASQVLLTTLDLAAADEELLVTLACTLGELGDPAAVAGLHALAARDGLTPAVLDEIDIALQHIARR